MSKSSRSVSNRQKNRYESIITVKNSMSVSNRSSLMKIFQKKDRSLAAEEKKQNESRMLPIASIDGTIKGMISHHASPKLERRTNMRLGQEEKLIDMKYRPYNLDVLVEKVILAPPGIHFPNKVEGFVALRQDTKITRSEVGASIIFENLQTIRRSSMDSTALKNQFTLSQSNYSNSPPRSNSKRILNGFDSSPRSNSKRLLNGFAGLKLMADTPYFI